MNEGTKGFIRGALTGVGIVLGIVAVSRTNGLEKRLSKIEEDFESLNSDVTGTRQELCDAIYDTDSRINNLEGRVERLKNERTHNSDSKSTTRKSRSQKAVEPVVMNVINQKDVTIPHNQEVEAIDEPAPNDNECEPMIDECGPMPEETNE